MQQPQDRHADSKGRNVVATLTFKTGFSTSSCTLFLRFFWQFWMPQGSLETPARLTHDFVGVRKFSGWGCCQSFLAFVLRWSQGSHTSILRLSCVLIECCCKNVENRKTIAQVARQQRGSPTIVASLLASYKGGSVQNTQHSLSGFDPPTPRWSSSTSTHSPELLCHALLRHGAFFLEEQYATSVVG